jgi:hypothetical protein
MRRSHVLAIAALALGVVACERQVRDYALPSDAQTTSNGIKYIVLRAGDGRLAKEGQIWSVGEKLLSHAEPGCQ